jgi:hypothetical protein
MNRDNTVTSSVSLLNEYAGSYRRSLHSDRERENRSNDERYYTPQIGICSYPWETAAAANLTSPPPPPQDEDIPAAKRLRLQISTSIPTADTVIDAYATGVAKTALPDDTVAIAPTDAVTGAALLSSGGAFRAHTPPCIWKPEEDAMLTQVIMEIGEEWVRVAAMVLGRNNIQCCKRWVESVDPNVERRGWTVEEDTKLTGAVNKCGKEDWVAVAALVPGRKNIQCRKGWVDSLDPNITLGNQGKWTVEEDTKLVDAVNKHGSNWVAVAVLVPRRTNIQCRCRWVESLDPNITLGKWAAEEDAKLTGAVKKTR